MLVSLALSNPARSGVCQPLGAIQQPLVMSLGAPSRFQRVESANSVDPFINGAGGAWVYLSVVDLFLRDKVYLALLFQLASVHM